MPPVTVLLADAHDLDRSRMAREIRAHDGLELVGTASSGESAVARIGELQPDVALVNTRMPGLDGLEVARRVAADRPATRVVLLAADPTEDVRRRARDCGADACVSKALPRRDILDIAARAGHAR